MTDQMPGQMTDQTAKDRIMGSVEDAEQLDSAAQTLRSVSGRIPEALRRVLTGEVIGSPLHPALVHLPIGASVSALLVEVVGGESQTPSTRLLAGLTVASAIPSALSGLADYRAAYGAGVRRVGAAHALVAGTGNALAIATLACSGAKHRFVPRMLLAGCVGAYLAAGMLGGHLVHDRGQTGPAADD